MIDGVVIQTLKQIEDERGKVMHMLRSDSPLFERFGEIYFSIVNPGAVKAWKLHQKMTLNLAVPVGEIKLVLYDNRSDSSTKGKVQEFIVGENNYCLIRIPPMIWNGFQGIASYQSVIANCATLPHDSSEVIRMAPLDNCIPYNWN